MLTESTIFYFLLAIFALLVGSLLNVMIYRIPMMLRQEYLNECSAMLNIEPQNPQPTVNLFFPRSFCPSCKNTVKAIHNIPVLSFLWLRGRCFHCGEKISLRYPSVEIFSCIAALFAAFNFGFGIELIFALLFIWILTVLALIDLDCQLLPDTLTLGLLWLGLIANTAGLFTSLQDAVLSAAGAWLVLWLFIKVFYLITGKVGMGHGDFKLFSAFGAWFGWMYLPLILLFSSITGAIISFIYLGIKRKSTNTPVPFGPFLCLSGLMVLFWGSSILQGYLKISGFQL